MCKVVESSFDDLLWLFTSKLKYHIILEDDIIEDGIEAVILNFKAEWYLARSRYRLTVSVKNADKHLIRAK